MKKTGILTYHYSNNFGGVLQSYALYKFLESKGIDVEIINYIPKDYNGDKILYSTGLRKIIKEPRKYNELFKILKRILIKLKYNVKIIEKFDAFRKTNMHLSNKVDEDTISSILQDYQKIIVGSDQIWHPGQRNRIEYFLGYSKKYYNGEKIAYAADSTTSEINQETTLKLKDELRDFNAISVRNQHSREFVKKLIGDEPKIVVDPTLLWEFDVNESNNIKNATINKPYILVYALGKEIDGTNKKVIERIKEKYGELKVYSVSIPTMKFNFDDYADQVFYDLGPLEWIELIRNAAFVFTDSYHGTLFSIKYHKPFLAYYTEELRATRFIDMADRYGINRFIINSIKQIDEKQSLNFVPDFEKIDSMIEPQKKESIEYLNSVFKFNQENRT